MKKLTILLTVLICVSLALSVDARRRRKKPPDEKIDYLTHQMAINKIIAEKCERGEDFEKQLNNASKSNPTNATIIISKNASEKCLESLRENSTCDSIFTLSIETPCDLKTLKGAE